MINNLNLLSYNNRDLVQNTWNGKKYDNESDEEFMAMLLDDPETQRIIALEKASTANKKINDNSNDNSTDEDSNDNSTDEDSNDNSTDEDSNDNSTDEDSNDNSNNNSSDEDSDSESIDILPKYKKPIKV
jgi:hypothetical protein